jgi:hypothetical protein
VVRPRYHGVAGFEVLLYLDKAGRPIRRIDALLPNDKQVTIETTWQAWGTKVQIPKMDAVSGPGVV